MKKTVLLILLVAVGMSLVAQAQDNSNHGMFFHSLEEDSSCPIAEAIDLGLPSGTKWASWNVGSSAPWEYGDYFAWGETESKEDYSWSTYKYCDDSYSTCQHIGVEIAGTKYDVAHVRWGGSWRMPSLEDVKELISCCSRMWIKQNGVFGTLVIGPNGASIFLPAAGHRWQDNLINEGLIGCYWISTLYPYHEYEVYNLSFNSGYWYWTNNYRSYGFSVRPICP
ncbi:MAG: hypothetical protein IKX59_07455 [Bacteroidales bacterium]|nr:hypothetical protein [Bacteroidales bacterium]